MPFIQLHKAALHVVDEADKRARGLIPKIPGLLTGFPILDQQIGGLRKKNLYTIGAVSGLGKSAAALGIAKHVASNGHKVLYYSLEMDATLLAARAISSETGIPTINIEQGLLSESEQELLKNTTLTNLDIMVCDDTVNTNAIRDLSRKYQEKHGLDLIIVDYLALLSDSDMSGNEVMRLEHISGAMKALSRDLDIPIVVVVQLNRDTMNNEGNVPNGRNIRFGDKVKSDSFAVLLLHRPYFFEQQAGGLPDLFCEDAMIIVDKNRGGKMGRIEMNFYPSIMKWEEKGNTIPQSPPAMRSLESRAKKERTKVGQTNG